VNAANLFQTICIGYNGIIKTKTKHLRRTFREDGLYVSVISALVVVCWLQIQFTLWQIHDAIW